MINNRQLMKLLAEQDANQRGWTCYLCGVEITSTTLTADHVIPRSRIGGRTARGNIRACCLPCNIRKDNLTLSEYEARYRVTAAYRHKGAA